MTFRQQQLYADPCLLFIVITPSVIVEIHWIRMEQRIFKVRASSLRAPPVSLAVFSSLQFIMLHCHYVFTISHAISV